MPITYAILLQEKYNQAQIEQQKQAEKMKNDLKKKGKR